MTSAVTRIFKLIFLLFLLFILPSTSCKIIMHLLSLKICSKWFNEIRAEKKGFGINFSINSLKVMHIIPLFPMQWRKLGMFKYNGVLNL